MTRIWILETPDTESYTAAEAAEAIAAVSAEFGIPALEWAGESRDTGFGQEQAYFLPDSVDEAEFCSRLSDWL